MNTELWLDPTVSMRFCLTLLHSLWQMTLLAGIAWIVDRLWNCRAVERSYAVHVTMLIIGVAALPITYTFVDVPASFQRPAIRIAPSAPPALAVASSETEVAAPMVADATQTRTDIRAASAMTLPLASTASVPPTSYDSANADFIAAWRVMTAWIVALYTLGVLIMSTRLAGGLWHAHRLAVRAQPLGSGPLVELLESLAQQWSMRVTPALSVSERVVVPKVVGLLQPTILLPASAVTGLSVDELRMILGHELAHVRRHDLWVNLLQRLAETVLFFNPALWYLSRRTSTLREYCCDELACRTMSSTTRARYANALVRVAELSRPTLGRYQPTQSRSNNLAALAATGRSPSELRRRIAHLFGEPIQEPVRLSRGTLVILVACIGLLLVGPFTLPSNVGSTQAVLADDSTKSVRTLQFPADRAMGVVYIRPAASSSFSFDASWYENWQPLAPAKGMVQVPDGQHVRLDISRDASADLRPLADLMPNGIEWLSVEGTTFTNDQLKYVGHLTGLRYLNLEETPITDEGFQNLAGLHQLQILKLSAFDVHHKGHGVGDGAMAVVAQLPALESIDLRLTKVTDRGLADLAKCKSLRNIGLPGTPVTDAGLEHLLKLPNLVWLSLGVYKEGAKITDKGLKTIAQIKGLTILNLSGTPITNEGLKELSTLTNLQRLALDETPVTEDGIAHLEPLKKLEHLRLYCSITDAGARHLSRLTSLKGIGANLEVSDAGVAELAKLPHLEQLMLSGEEVTDASLEHIARMQSLQWLWFQDCRVSDRGLAQLRNSPTIEYLLIHQTEMTTAGLNHLMTIPNLRILDLDLKGQASADWQPLKQFPSLKEFRVDGTAFRNRDMSALQGVKHLTDVDLDLEEPVDDAGLHALKPLTYLRSLRINSSVVTDDGLASLGGMKELKSLTISCLATDAGVQTLSNLSSLRSMQIASPFITDQGIAALAKRLPSLQNVNKYKYRLGGSSVSVSAKDKFFRHGESDERSAQDALEGQLPPVLAGQRWLNTGGAAINLADLRGKVVLVDFWGTWCGPCLQQMPELKRLHTTYHGQGLEIVGIHTTSKSDNVEKYVTDEAIPWSVTVDVDKQTTTAWKVNSYPGYYLVDRNGRVRYADIFKGHLESAIQQLLAEKADIDGKDGKDISKNPEAAETAEKSQQDTTHLNIVIARHVMLLDGQEIVTWKQLQEKIAALPNPSLVYPHFYITRGAMESGTESNARENIWNFCRDHKFNGHSEGSLSPRADLRYDGIKGPADLVSDATRRVDAKVVDSDGKPVAGAEVVLVAELDKSLSYRTHEIYLVAGRIRNPLEEIMTRSSETGEFAIYPLPGKSYYVLALHPDRGFALTSDKQFIPDRQVRLLEWGGLTTGFSQETEEQEATLRTNVTASDDIPEISITQYWHELKQPAPTLVFTFKHVPPIFNTTISRSFRGVQGGSFSLPGASVSLLPGETRRIDLGPMSKQQRDWLNELRKQSVERSKAAK